MRKILAFIFALGFTSPSAAQMTLGTLGSGGAGISISKCPQATAYLARVTVDATHQTAYTTLICSAVIHGYWSKFDALYVFATQNSTTALINLPNAAYSATANGAPTFTADSGYTTASNKWVDTGFTLNAGTNFVQNSAMLGVWTGSSGTSAQFAIQAAAAAGGGDRLNPRTAANAMFGQINSGSSQTSTTTVASAAGLDAMDRPSSTKNQFYQNGAQVGTDLTVSSIAPTSAHLETAGDNTNSTNTGVYIIRAIFAASSFNSTDMANFYADLGAYLTTMGHNP